MFCILKIGCRCAFEIAKEAERDEIGLAGKQQFAGRARRMAAAHSMADSPKMKRNLKIFTKLSLYIYSFLFKLDNYFVQ